MSHLVLVLPVPESYLNEILIFKRQINNGPKILYFFIENRVIDINLNENEHDYYLFSINDVVYRFGFFVNENLDVQYIYIEQWDEQQEWQDNRPKILSLDKSLTPFGRIYDDVLKFNDKPKDDKDYSF
jgi:hypothetical protein